MSEHNRGDRPQLDEQLDNLILEFYEQLDRGENPSPADFIAAHPEYRDELQQHFADVAAIEDIAGPTASSCQVEQTLITSDTKSQALDGTFTSQTQRKDLSGAVGDLSLKTFGRYTIMKELGRGAMGAVYLAKDEQLGREIALKIPKFDSEADPGLLERFYQEARSAAVLHHPGICPVHDVGEIDGQHYITMAYIQGRPLRDFTKSSKRQPGKQVARVIRKIALAMAEAHEHNVIHRDLKPANVMIDRKNEPVVMDFGLARRSVEGEERLTHTGTIIGTPAYMSPEQVGGDPGAVGAASDIYSLGVIFYELLTGRLPFEGHLMAILQQIATKEPTPPRELHDDVDPFLQTLCLQMLAKDAASRPATMLKVAEELAAWLSGRRSEESGVLETSHVGSVQQANSDRTQLVAQSLAPAPEVVPVIVTDTEPSVAGRRRPSRTASRSPARSAAQLPPWKNPRVLLGGLGGVGVLLAVVLFFIRTPYGTLRVEVFDPDIEVSVKGTGIVVRGTNTQGVEVSPGDHTLHVKGGAFDFDTAETLRLKKGDQVVVKVELIEGQVQVVHEGKVIGTAALVQSPFGVPTSQSPISGFFGDAMPKPTTPVTNSTPTAANSTTPAATPAAPFVKGGNFGLRFARNEEGKPRGSVSVPSLREPRSSLTMDVWVSSPNLDPPAGWVVGFHGKNAITASLPGVGLYEYTGSGNFHQKIIVRAGFKGIVENMPLHLAAVRDTERGECRFYVNGRLVDRLTYDSPGYDGNPLVLGSNGHHGFRGWMDEIRISSVARYDDDFTPQRRYSSDKDTLALYHCDEGQGDILKDSSGNNHHGTISGGQWVRLDSTNTGANSTDSLADAPPPAVAPFDETQAKAHQKAWADYLGEPVVVTNSVGMKLAIIPPGRFDRNQKNETTLFRIGVHEVTQEQWTAVMGTAPWNGRPNVQEGPRVAANYLTWNAVVEFCDKLTDRDLAAGRLRPGQRYRLPTTVESEWACQAGTNTRFSFGDDESLMGDYAWYLENTKQAGEDHPHEVGVKKPNAWGLFDVHGNVAEWCAAPPQVYMPFRGGSWKTRALGCQSREIASLQPGSSGNDTGFRVVLSSTTKSQAVGVTPDAAASPPELTTPTPPPAVAPFDATAAKAHQQAWADYLGEPVVTANSIGMKLAVIPPGTFTMGEGGGAVDVTLTKPFRIGVHEVTQGQWRAVMETEPWKGTPIVLEDANVPATYVTWIHAVEYCRKLTDSERESGKLLDGWEYRLPTETEWEWACRSGTTTSFSFGDDEQQLEEYAFYKSNANDTVERYAHAIGLKKPNPWGLFDMHGNVWERCSDWHGDALPGGTNPTGPTEGSNRVRRGGSWLDSAQNCRSASRFGLDPSDRGAHVGFRVALYPTGGQVSRTTTSDVTVVPGSTSSAGGVGPSLQELLTSSAFDWHEPENLGPTINSPGIELRPTLSRDQLTIYFSSEDRSRQLKRSVGRILVATRKSREERFSEPTELDDPAFAEEAAWGPFLFAGDCRMAHVVRRNNKDQILVASRSSPDEPFDSVEDTGISGNWPTLTADGLIMVYRSDRHLAMVERQSLDTAFGEPVSLFSFTGTEPFLSPDGLTLVFGRSFENYLSVVSRQSRSDRFEMPLKVGPPFNVGTFNGATWFSPEHDAVYFVSRRPGGFGDADIYVSTRTVQAGASQ
jgi:formylglycine-generating enzyme required for sulfatase activity/serine/threonine protein kinase